MLSLHTSASYVLPYSFVLDTTHGFVSFSYVPHEGVVNEVQQ